MSLIRNSLSDYFFEWIFFTDVYIFGLPSPDVVTGISARMREKLNYSI